MDPIARRVELKRRYASEEPAALSPSPRSHMTPKRTEPGPPLASVDEPSIETAASTRGTPPITATVAGTAPLARTAASHARAHSRLAGSKMEQRGSKTEIDIDLTHLKSSRAALELELARINMAIKKNILDIEMAKLEGLSEEELEKEFNKIDIDKEEEMKRLNIDGESVSKLKKEKGSLGDMESRDGDMPAKSPPGSRGGGSKRRRIKKKKTKKKKSKKKRSKKRRSRKY